MSRKDELLEQMKLNRQEWDSLSYKLDFTTITDEQKIAMKIRKSQLRDEYKLADKERSEIIRKELWKDIL